MEIKQNLFSQLEQSKYVYGIQIILIILLKKSGNQKIIHSKTLLVFACVIIESEVDLYVNVYNVNLKKNLICRRYVFPNTHFTSAFKVLFGN